MVHWLILTEISHLLNVTKVMYRAEWNVEYSGSRRLGCRTRVTRDHDW